MPFILWREKKKTWKKVNCYIQKNKEEKKVCVFDKNKITFRLAKFVTVRLMFHCGVSNFCFSL